MPRAMISKGTEFRMSGAKLCPHGTDRSQDRLLSSLSGRSVSELGEIEFLRYRGGGKRIPASSASTALAEFEFEFLSSVMTDFPLS
jgi:hypothetical protein